MGRLRKIKDDLTKLQVSKYFIFDPTKITLNQKNEIEIGCGKGQFIINKALNNKEINYYGIDKFATVLLKATNKIKNNNLSFNNLHFLNLDALELNKYFANNSIDCIYLNFSDPWPKKRHKKRRLTSSNYLNIYKNILKKDGHIEFKTDNYDFFVYTKELLEGLKDVEIFDITDDLYHSKYLKQNIPTEYEEKFIKQNKKINLIKFRFV